MVEIRLKKKAAIRVGYRMDPDKKSATARALYHVDSSKKKAAAKALYHADPDKKRAASRIYYTNNHSSRLRSFNCCHKGDICLLKKAMYMYILPQPKPTVKDMYLKDIQLNLAGNCEPISMLRGSFNCMHPGIGKTVLGITVCRLAAKRLLNKALQLRKM